MVPVMAEISSEQRLRDWLLQECALKLRALEAMPQVISNRCYYRAVTSDASYIVTDASESPDAIAQFPATSDVLRQAGLYTPALYRAELTQGWLLQEDLGQQHWHDCVQHGAIKQGYQHILADVRRMQGFDCTESGIKLPDFDWQHYAERAWQGACMYWRYENKAPTSLMEDELGDTIQLSVDLCQQAPRVLCHRDFHSRNIMVLPDDGLAYIDFQMLCRGPMVYDLASLLRDAYVDIPDAMMEELLRTYFSGCDQKNWLVEVNWPEFLLWFDAATVLRYLRCLGLFCRWQQQPLYYKAKLQAVNYLTTVARRQPLFEHIEEYL